jgi:hypothetical protein
MVELLLLLTLALSWENLGRLLLCYRSIYQRCRLDNMSLRASGLTDLMLAKREAYDKEEDGPGRRCKVYKEE